MTAALTGNGECGDTDVIETQTNEVITVEQAEQTDEATEGAEWLPFEATAYTADCRGCIGITKAGIDVRQTTTYSGKTVIAVDPDVIPLWSEVIVRLADGTEFEAVALDTGGSIRGNRIDVLHERREAAMEFGRQAVEVRIVTEVNE